MTHHRPVTIVLDVDRLFPGEQDGAAVDVDSVREYPGAYLAIRFALHGGNPASIRVHDRTVAAWLADVARTYGDTHILLRHYTPRDALADRWHVDIPASVTDVDILRSRLLEEEIDIRDGQTFADALLEHFFGEALAHRRFPVGGVVAALAGFEPRRWDDAVGRPLVARLLRERLAQWKQTATSEAARSLIGRLGADPVGLRRDLTLYAVLRDYPDVVGSRVLKIGWGIMRGARVEAERVNPIADEWEATVPEIELFLADAARHAVSPEDLATVVGQVSGYLPAEFHAVESLVRAHPDWLTPDLLRRVERRFHPIREGIGTALAALRSLIRPPFPAEPHDSWGAGEWLEWARASYMPYYAWLDNQGARDDTVAGYANVFADWMYEHFIDLKNGQPHHFAFSVLNGEVEHMKAGDTVSLILVIDNLNYAFFDDLRRLFARHDFSLQGGRAVLSLIPTATEVSKAALMAGRGDQVDVAGVPYPALVDREWTHLLGRKRATYLPTIGALQGVRERDHDVYFLNYILPDEHLHADRWKTGRPHADAVREDLAGLVASVAEFVERFRLESRVRVYTISDHGSTRIGKDVANRLDRALFKDVSEDEHRRYVAISDKELAMLPQVADTQCYRIDRAVHKTDRNYLAARHYYRFVETSRDSYVHGGLTPEEMVVPFAVFTRAPVTPLPPLLDLPTRVFRYETPAVVTIEVRNPNPFALDAVNIHLVEVEADDVSIPSIGALDTVRVEAVTRFRRVIGTSHTREITIRVRYEYQDRPFGPDDTTVPIALKTIMEVPDDDLDIF